jgi:hypothetical protein
LSIDYCSRQCCYGATRQRVESPSAAATPDPYFLFLVNFLDLRHLPDVSPNAFPGRLGEKNPRIEPRRVDHSN